MPIPIVRIDEIEHLDKSAAEGKAILVAASEIVRLRDEILRLTSAGLNAASGEAIKADEANEYCAEIERLEARCDTLAEREAEARSAHNTTLEVLHKTTNELEAMRVEYTALWTVVIAYMNAPNYSAEEEYSALVRQAMKSRFWNQQSS